MLTVVPGYPRDASFVAPGDRHVYVCQDPPAEALRAGRAVPLPAGEFDVREIWSRLPAGFVPDVVWVSSSLAGAPGRPTPRGVEQLPCPAVMKLSDTHHTPRPIRTVIDYARRVGCGHHWSAYNRQHLHFFVEAGLPNVFWMPGAVSMVPQVTRPEALPAPAVLFCGSVDRTHPYRTRLLDVLRSAGVPVRLGRRPGELLPWPDYLQRYVETTIVFNASLNGDLGRRVFEVLMAGGFLLTDRLAPAAGLARLFEEGVHLECYGSEAELLEKVRHYLARPEAAATIARRGQAELLARYHPYRLIETFYRIVLAGAPVPPLLAAADDPRVARAAAARGRDPDAFGARLECYELLQELHRLNPVLRLLDLDGGEDPGAADWDDLPRLRVVRAAGPPGPPAGSEPFDVVAVDAGRAAGDPRLLETARRALAPGGLVVVRHVAPAARQGLRVAAAGTGLEPLPTVRADAVLALRDPARPGSLRFPAPPRPPGVLGQLRHAAARLVFGRAG